MILLPIGHEESAVRRLPWVTFGIMGLCLLCFMASGRAMLFAEDDVGLSEDVGKALEYFLTHPYLELDPRLHELVFDDADEANEWLDVMGEAVPPPTGPGQHEAEQQELNELTARALARYDAHPLMRWGLSPDAVSPVALLTHIFLHVGWLHLLGNMLILYLAGPFIEDVWGRPLYLGFYVLGGVVAALSHVAAQPDSSAPLIGASGAIAGVMGAFLVRYRSTKIRFFYMVGLFWRGTFDAPAWLMLPLWFGEQLFFASMTQGSGGAGVAYWAHIGGFVFGVGVASAMAWQKVEQRYLAGKIERKVETAIVDHRGVEAALDQHARGESTAAVAALSGEVSRNPSSPDVALALWAVASESEQLEPAAPALLEATRSLLRRGEVETALELWQGLTEHLPALRAEPALAVRVAQALLETRRREEALINLRRALLGPDGAPPATLALKIAQLARELDGRLARAAARIALSSSDLDPDGQAMANRLLQELGSVGSRGATAAD